MIPKPLSLYPYICFDFDGVIKDSVSVKGDIFVHLFRSFPVSLRDKILAHHLENGGVNRRAKLMQYLQWAYPDLPRSNLPIDLFLNDFSSYTVERVVNSAWISSMPDLLFQLSKSSFLFVASATPHDEILKIVNLLNIDSCFKGVWGYPYSKSDVLRHIQNTYNCTSLSLIMVGDSEQDRLAAQNTNSSFFLKSPNNHFVV